MRTAEAQTLPDSYRGVQGLSVAFPASQRAFRVLAAGTLAAALIAAGPVAAQSSSNIADRIEATFDLVLGNTADLAIPLTRRALARRSAVRHGGVAPLAYGPLEGTTPDEMERAAAEPIEQGSAEDDSELARLPRPRPIIISEATADKDLIGQPLDLVAGAAITAEEAASAVAAASAGVGSAVLVPAPVSAPVPAPRPGELVASQSCLSVKDVADKDGDFKRNAEALSADGLCIAEEKFKERKRRWVIQTVVSKQPGPLWAVMHDDEDLSFDNAVEALKRFGGTLVTVETGGKRNLSGIDPNRNFSADGVGCRKFGKNAAPRYTKFFAELMDSANAIVALHNNSGERIPTGGLGHVSMKTVPKDMGIVRPKDANGPLAGKRALVLLTDVLPLSTTSQAAADELAAKGVNVVIEKVREGRGDCSLSNYAVLTGHTHYFNVTVDSDERDKQMRIVDMLMSDREETVASQ